MMTLSQFMYDQNPKRTMYNPQFHSTLITTYASNVMTQCVLD